jgi:hypothetical protein
MATFTVDTHLFRELGELLVGRDSTALIELIKNSYGADATEVTVYGQALSSTSQGLIRIQDNGIGMSRGEFEEGFLRIASRQKETRERRSQILERRYTGAKGIGRLAAHKLARIIEITSSRWNGTLPRHGKPSALRSLPKSLEASINWDKVESKRTLDEIDGTDAISIDDVSQPNSFSAGTTITLRRLRRSWTPAEHARFMEEVQAFQPPPALVNPIPKQVVSRRNSLRYAEGSGCTQRIRERIPSSARG